MLEIHWYGVMYAVAFWVAYILLPYLGKLRDIQQDRNWWTMLVVCGAVGVLLGGRIGYAVLYEPAYFFTHPLELFAIWNGGMSSHGGFIGVAVAMWLFVSPLPFWEMARVRGVRSNYDPSSAPVAQGLQANLLPEWEKGATLLQIADIITIPVAIGLALGRVGNIINHEFGMYPYAEAVGDVAIGVVCFVMLKYGVASSPLPFWERARVRGVRSNYDPSSAPVAQGLQANLLPEWEKGATFAVFLILYTILRFSLEYVRPQEWPYTFGLTRGQFLTIPIFIGGVLLFLYVRSQSRTTNSR